MSSFKKFLYSIVNIHHRFSSAHIFYVHSYKEHTCVLCGKVGFEHTFAKCPNYMNKHGSG